MKRVVLIVLLAAIACALCFVARQCSTQHDSNTVVGTIKQERVEAAAALRKAAGFLQPDTTSDIRFGRSNAQTPILRASASPTIR
jgi:hypothetical protein